MSLVIALALLVVFTWFVSRHDDSADRRGRAMKASWPRSS
jgi:hypothetical protein